MRELLGQRLQHQAGRVVARSAPGFHARLEAGEQLAFGIEVLEYRFDDNIRVCNAVAADIGAQPLACGRALRGSRRLLSTSSRERCSAGSMYSMPRSCKVTVKPRSADQAAMSAHYPGADHVYMFTSGPPLPPSDLSRSCSRNTRTRLREVSVVNS